MGVDVILKRVDQKGTSPKNRRLVALDTIVDSSDEFAGICARAESPMLRSVDPYGSLILTVENMDQFISEIEAVRLVHSGDRADVLSRVLELARRCAAGGSMELHCEGD